MDIGCNQVEARNSRTLKKNITLKVATHEEAMELIRKVFEILTGRNLKYKGYELVEQDKPWWRRKHFSPGFYLKVIHMPNEFVDKETYITIYSGIVGLKIVEALEKLGVAIKL